MESAGSGRIEKTPRAYLSLLLVVGGKCAWIPFPILVLGFLGLNRLRTV